MKSFKSLQLTEKPSIYDNKFKHSNLSQINSKVQFGQKSHQKSLPQNLQELTIDLKLPQAMYKRPSLVLFKRIKTLGHLNLILRNSDKETDAFISSLRFVRIKSLDITLEHFSLFQVKNFQNLFAILGRNVLGKISITIQYPDNCGGNMLVSFFRESVCQFTDGNFRILSRKISSLPKLNHLKLKFKSFHLINLTKKSMSYMAKLLPKLQNLMSLNLTIAFKDVDYPILNSFSNSLAKKSNLKSLKLFLLGFRKVSPDPLFNAISLLSNLRDLAIENDCGWDEPNIQELATSCEKLSNLESFHFSYFPSEKMAFNPLFRQTLVKFTKLRELSLTLSAIGESDLFDLSHSLQYLVNLEKLDLHFLTTAFNLKNMNRFCSSLSGLKNMKILALKFLQCKLQENEILFPMMNSLKSLTNLKDITFYLLSTTETDYNQVLTQFLSRFLESLQEAKTLVNFDLKLEETQLVNLSDYLHILFDFCKNHQELKIFKLGLLKTAIDETSKKAFQKFFQKERPPKLDYICLYNDRDTFSEKQD